jgi:hypothetical protein
VEFSACGRPPKQNDAPHVPPQANTNTKVNERNPPSLPSRSRRSPPALHLVLFGQLLAPHWALRVFRHQIEHLLTLLCVPLIFFSEHNLWGPGPTLVLAMLALMPLAERLSFLTEQLTLHSNETVGGGLNSTLGNALETVFSIVALVKAKLSLDAGEMTKQFFLALIQTSLLGSMLSYLLLVQGTVFLVGY